MEKVKILLENWRQYLTEGNAIDDNLELLSSAAFDEEQLAALNQLGFELVGRGSKDSVVIRLACPAGVVSVTPIVRCALQDTSSLGAAVPRDRADGE